MEMVIALVKMVLMSVGGDVAIHADASVSETTLILVTVLMLMVMALALAVVLMTVKTLMEGIVLVFVLVMATVKPLMEVLVLVFVLVMTTVKLLMEVLVLVFVLVMATVKPLMEVLVLVFVFVWFGYLQLIGPQSLGWFSHDLHTQLAEATHILSHPSNIYRNPSIYSGLAYRPTKKPFTSPLNSHTSCSTIHSLTSHISSNPHLHHYTSLRVQAVSDILYKHKTGLFIIIYHLDTPS